MQAESGFFRRRLALADAVEKAVTNNRAPAELPERLRLYTALGWKIWAGGAAEYISTDKKRPQPRGA